MRTVRAVERAIQILNLLADEGEMSVPEIATALNLPRSGTYEITYTLRNGRFVDFGSKGRVQLGHQVFALGHAYARHVNFLEVAQAIADETTRECNETTQVAVLENRHVFYIAKSDSTRAVRLVSDVGKRVPAHCTAVGKVLLANLDTKNLEQRIGDAELERLTPNSQSDPVMLRRELATIRTTGFALDDRESNPDVKCIAAPIFNADGQCEMAISISLPADRLSVEGRDELLTIVLAKAEELSTRLGYDASLSSISGREDEIHG